MALDETDRNILRALQRDGQLSTQELAELVNLSNSPCWRRVKRLEDSGYISGYVALVNPDKVALPVLAFTQISLDDHHPDTINAFDRFVLERPEILECCACSGEYDYLLKVRVQSMGHYEDFLLNGLLQTVSAQSVNTSFVMSQRKYTTALPVRHA